MQLLLTHTTAERLKALSRYLPTGVSDLIAHTEGELVVVWGNGYNRLDIFEIFDEDVAFYLDYDLIPPTIPVSLL